MERLGSNWMDFDVIGYLSIFSTFCRENSSFIYVGEEKRILHMKSCLHFWSCVQTFFEKHAIYQIMWKNIFELGRQQMTIWRMRTKFWIPKAIEHSLRIRNIYCFSTATMDAQTRLNVRLYAH